MSGKTPVEAGPPLPPAQAAGPLMLVILTISGDLLDFLSCIKKKKKQDPWSCPLNAQQKRLLLEAVGPWLVCGA